MKRTSKHQTTIIREDIVLALKLGALKESDKWNLQHVAKLIRERGDDRRINQLVDLFRIADRNKYASLKEFYWWYKDNQVSEMDATIYNIFDEVGEKLGLPQANPSAFAGLGESLVDRINEWKSGAGNKTDDILVDYFTGILPEAVAFNPALATSPKSLLGDYGWSLFESYILKQYSGKYHYLEASAEQLEASKQKGSMLQTIQYVRNNALEAGNLLEYDRIGRHMTKHGVSYVFEDLQNRGLIKAGTG